MQKASLTQRFPSDFVSSATHLYRLNEIKADVSRFKPQELTVQDTESKEKDSVPLINEHPSPIYSGITRDTLDQIKNIDLEGYVKLVMPQSSANFLHITNDTRYCGDTNRLTRTLSDVLAFVPFVSPFPNRSELIWNV